MDMIKSFYNNNSPYKLTPQVNQYVTYLDYWQPPVLTTGADDAVITLPEKYKHRPDLLSYDAYGTPGLWWIFAVYNSDTLQDPIYDMIPGVQIYVPSNQTLAGLL
jgi:hypothetical protein